MDRPIAPPWETPLAAPPNPKPRLQIPGDDRLTSIFAAELAGHLSTSGMFTLNGEAVVENVTRTGMQPFSAVRFVTWIEDWVTCYRIKQASEVERSLSVADASKVLSSSQFIAGLKPVQRYNPIRLPAFAANGTLKLLPVGYDESNQTLTARGSVRYDLDWPLDRAREYVNSLLSEFPFADVGQSKAAVIAAMLTIYGLHLLSPTCLVPAFVYTANDAGCGKGLCCMLAAVPVFGALPTGVQPTSEQEMEKLLFSVARSRQQVIFLDNVDRHLASPALESFLTTSQVSGRILGETTFASFPKKTVVLINGNNCTVRGDMRRRSVFVEFFMEELQAEHRRIENPLSESVIIQKRSEILSALYSLVKSWCDANKPPPKRLLQGFTEWSAVIAGIIEHASFGSPIAQPETNIADEELREMATLVDYLSSFQSTTGIPFRDLVEICQMRQLFQDKIREHGDLSRGEKTAFSRLLKRYTGRIFPGRIRFVVSGEGHARRYAAQPILPQPAPQAPPPASSETVPFTSFSDSQI
jgi:hypothetical protein